MPEETEVIQEPHSGKNGGHQKSVGGSRKLLQLFRLKPRRWRNKQSESKGKKQKHSPDERRDQLDRDMKNNWEQLPATLRRRKEKLSQAVLDQFTTDDEIQPNPARDSDNKQVSSSSVESSAPSTEKETAEAVNESALVSEQDSVSIDSLKLSSVPSQIVVKPQIHRECEDSSLELVESSGDKSCEEKASNDSDLNDRLVPTTNEEIDVKEETKAEIETQDKLEGDQYKAKQEEGSKRNEETHSPETSEVVSDVPITRSEEEEGSQENNVLNTCSNDVTQSNSPKESIIENSSFLEVKNESVSLSKIGNSVNPDSKLITNCDTQNNETEELIKTSASDNTDSQNKTDFKKLFLPNESYLYQSKHKERNDSVKPEPSSSSKLPEDTSSNQEPPRPRSPLSHEEQQVMALLSRAVSEDSLLIPSSPSSTSTSSVTSSGDERNHDSGTDVNSPSPSTSSSHTPVSPSHYQNPTNVLKSVEKAKDTAQASGSTSQDSGSATDSGFEKSLGSQSTDSLSSLSTSKNNGKSSKNSKQIDKVPPKTTVNTATAIYMSTKPESSSSGVKCCFSSLPDDPSLYEVVIPRAEYHKPSHIALKASEYQVPKEKLLHEIHDSASCLASSQIKEKLVCGDRSKVRNQRAKSPIKIESLGRDEEDVMSYYDSVVQEEQVSSNKDCDVTKDGLGNYSMHPKSKKTMIDGKEYEYIAKGLYVNDYVHVDLRNHKPGCSARSENGHINAGNVFSKRYAAMEFVSGFAKPVEHSSACSLDFNKAKGCVGVVDKTCADKVRWVPESGCKWKRPYLETLNKKPVTMATIMEEREGDADSSATTGNTSDSEKLSVREILRRFEELGGRMQLPTDISQVDGESDAEKSATLREIQETLRCLEEKVRHYETKAATTQTQEADENEKLQQKAAPRVADGLVPSKIALDSWTGHSRSAGHQQQSSVLQPHSNSAVSQQQQQQHHQHQQQHHQQRSIITSSPQPPEPPGRHDGKHSLLQFAMLHFRQSPEKFEMLKTADGSISGSLKVIESLKTNKKSKGKKGNKENDWTWKEQVDLVKFSSIPIEQSLLRLEPGELSELAVECFAAVMRYMGDLPMAPDSTEVKCVYTILMHCHKHEALRDEVYCQLMKQTTNNKSMKPDSCQRGWRLFSIVAAYFVCSDTLKPYLFKYLETAAYDKRRAYHGTATVCLQNLRKTFKYGGRKNVPSVEEITAISAGRNSKRQIYRLPGGTERVVNTKSTTVVQDVIEELCTVIGVTGGEMEMEEFSLYCIVEGDTFTMPLAREEYILDVTTELHKNQQVFYLIFCRSVWHFPLRLDSQLYVEVVFNQIAPDYLEGLLLVMPGEQLDQDVIYDIAKMAALLHRAADMTHVPTMKETKFLLPKPALTVRDVKPAQWVNMVQSNWRDVETLTTIQSKAQVLDILSKWPLFGSSFFAVKRVSDPKERSDHILALNRHGVHFIDLVTHETLTHYPFSEVISTRKVKSEDGTLFLDMKCGNLMQQRITRLQTDQAHEISRLIRQYITMEQRLQQRSVA